MGDAAWDRCDLVTPDIRDDHGAVLADTQLGPMRLADADSLCESERRIKPGDGGAYVRVDEHRRHGGRRRRTIGQHNREPSERWGPRRGVGRPRRWRPG